MEKYPDVYILSYNKPIDWENNLHEYKLYNTKKLRKWIDCYECDDILEAVDYYKYEFWLKCKRIETYSLDSESEMLQYMFICYYL